MTDPRGAARWSLPLFLAVAVIWSWPLALHPLETTVSLHFDQYPAAWLVHAAGSYVPDGVSEWSAWPAGEPIVRLDSFLFALLAVALGGVVPGLLVTNLFVLLGPAVSAWAAERFAREALGARFPASLLAGLAFGFSPLALVGVLEGHVYYLLNPWLPLLALHTWRGESARAAIQWTLCLLTTAYMGVNGLLVLGAILVYQRRLDLRLLVPVAVVGAVYAALFLGGQGATVRDGHDAVARLGAASLLTLVSWNPWWDLTRHSLAPVIAVLPLCLSLLAPIARAPHRRFLLALGFGCVVLAIGPSLEYGLAPDARLPTLLHPLLSAGFFDVLRFPVRFAWVAALAFGSLGALVVSDLSHRWRLGFVALGVVDVLVLSGAVFRVAPHPVTVPSIYARLPDGAVLDVYAEVGNDSNDIGYFQQNLSCWYQTVHRHPIVDRCLNTDLTRSPRRAAGKALHAALLAEADPRSVLVALDVASVVVHLDLYQPHERARVVEGLERALGAATNETRDGGEWLMSWSVP